MWDSKFVKMLPDMLDIDVLSAVTIDSSTTVTAGVGVGMLAEVVRVIILSATSIDLEFVMPRPYTTDGIMPDDVLADVNVKMLSVVMAALGFTMPALLEEESLLFC